MLPLSMAGTNLPCLVHQTHQEEKMNRNRIPALLSAIVILSFILTACGTPATSTAAPTNPPAPTSPPAATLPPAATQPPPSKYTEAPALAELVKAGKLPVVDKRVSDMPIVMKPVEEVGQYGGTWRV